MLRCERLADRDTPAALFDPTTTIDPPPFPGYDGEVRYFHADVDDNQILDTVYLAGTGGGCRVRVVYGGDGVFHEIAGYDRAGNPILRQGGQGNTLFDGFVFKDLDARIGLDGVGVDPGDGPWDCYFTWLAGGGPVVAKGEFDAATRTWSFTEFLAADPDYRGGLKLDNGSVWLTPEDAGLGTFSSHLIVIPREGGGPVVRAYDAAGNLVSNVLVGPADDRREYGFGNAMVGVRMPGSEKFGFGVVTPDNTTKLFAWDGEFFGETGDASPGAAWRT